MLQNYTTILFRFYISFVLRLTFSHRRIHWFRKLSSFSKMLGILICHFKRILRIPCKFIRHRSIERFRLIIFKIWDIMHKCRLFLWLNISLFMISKSREIMFILRFQCSNFTNLFVRFILGMQYIFSCFNIIPT